MTGRKATRLRQGSGEGNEGAYSMTYAEIVKSYPGAEHMSGRLPRTPPSRS